MLQKIKNNIKISQSFLKKNFKHISAGFFVLGFFLDYLTLPDVTNIISIYIGGALFLIIGSLIYFREYIETEKINFKNEDKYVNYLSLAIALLLGSFTSFVFVYYLRGGEIISNVPILLLILGLMFSNEFIKNKFRLYVDLASYSLASIFYFIFAVPYVFKKINNITFLFSLVLSSVILYFYLREIHKINLDIFKMKIQNFIFVPIFLISILYFTNIFPAVPLNLNYAGLYKNVYVNTQSATKEYVLEEKINRSFLSVIKNLSFKKVINKNNYQSGSLYFYAELQAPNELNAKVTHRWEYYNESSKNWEVRSEVSYNIFGGRTAGYRGYSKINNLDVGEYKVTVLVDDKRVAGRVRFEVR